MGRGDIGVRADEAFLRFVVVFHDEDRGQEEQVGDWCGATQSKKQDARARHTHQKVEDVVDRLFSQVIWERGVDLLYRARTGAADLVCRLGENTRRYRVC